MCYLMILPIIGSSTELALFHVGCRPSLHVGLSWCLYLTLSQNGPCSTYIWPWLVIKACPTLTSDDERNLIPSPCQNGRTLTSDHGRNLILSPCQNGPTLTSDLLIRMSQPLYLSYSSEWPSPYIWTWKEPHPLTMSECPSPYIWPTR